MARTPSVPRYRLHKPSGQAVVTVRTTDGGRRDIYLGKYNTDESRREYGRILAELSVAPTPDRVAVLPTGRVADLTVNELLLAFWKHAEQHYRRPDGTPTNELNEYRQTFKPVRELYGHTPAAEFGPLALKAVRGKMVASELCRSLVNQRVGRVRRVFKWGAGEELISFEAYQRLTAVTGLQRGRSGVRDTDPVEPVEPEHVEATLPFLRPEVAAMVRVQLLTGMRPGEVCQLRPCDIDTSGAVWHFRPVQYKTRHRGKPRVVAIGPKARAVLAGFTPPDPAGYYFSPRRAVERLHAERTAARRTPRYPSHMRRNAAKRVKAARRMPADCYNVTAYGHAIARAVEKANRGRVDIPAEFVGPTLPPVPHWHPNQLRHTHGTEVRRRYGLEAAQVTLGHSRADVTQVYAERNLALAEKVAAEIG